jgi:acetoin utilization protein AcuB
MDATCIATLMTTAPSVLSPKDPLDLAARVMRGTRARQWPVAEDRLLVGMLSLRDLLTEYARKNAGAPHDPRTTGQVMRRSAVIAHPSDDVLSAAERMRHHRLWCLPVIDGDELVGVVTINHLVDYAVEALHQEAEHLGIAPTVARLMTYSPLSTVELLDRVDVAQALMRHYGVRHLPVMRGHRLLGIVSERDILEVLRSSLERPSDIQVGEIMSYPLETTTPESPAAQAGVALLAKQIGALPVLRGGRMVGILSKSDFLSYLVATRPPSESLA